ncbi:MAG: HAMP domain-containing histidine kinase [Candidatus Eremiobacteraeota bacterium]|nr:HAMP domain-containing histidine kinase [Candidatus Eremiobacteraeota bacterium]
MFKTTRLYFKLYLYFVAVILLLTLLFHISLYITGPPPHIFQAEMISIVADFVRNKPFDKDFETGLKRMAQRYNTSITIYDKEGKALYWTGDHKNFLDHKVMEQTEKRRIFTYDSILKGITLYVLPVEKNGTISGFIHIENRVSFLTSREFINQSLFSCLIVSILVFPLTLFITRPLRKITQKAVRFSQRDFSELSEEVEVKGDDEIAELNNAFNRMANELVGMLEEKKELIADISHELGSPLSRMKVAVETIENRMKAGKALSIGTVERLSRNINEMSDLVKELLDFSRIDKAYSLDLEEVDPGEIVNDLIKKFQLIINKKNINVKVDWNRNEGPVTADKAKLKRIVQNLLSNSLRYSSPDSQIEIKMKKEGERFIFAINDQGPGILEKNREKVFEPFYREDPSRTRGTGGAGLGLAIVRKLIVLHGGKIWVENPGESGAIISFII